MPCRLRGSPSNGRRYGTPLRAKGTKENQNKNDEARKKIRNLFKAETGNDIEPTDADVLKYYVVVEELIPEMSHGQHSNVGTVFFAVGFSVMMVLDVALG